MNLYTMEAQIDMVKAVKILHDIYTDEVDETTVKIAKELAKNSEIWKNISAIRYVAGVSKNWKYYKTIAKDARELIEDDLNN